ncbi:hypothetical protein ALC57_18914 [Trachymyrmex cornetzi]|uniref:Uncharacterized protein n=1 Tax=Trachymyrmex cornetzi TaxID=471704 RepID=A0A195D7V4_9HYME|nr:hypothetical protein ALC57_18914 [Trachymyrmex cornetzi]
MRSAANAATRSFEVIGIAEAHPSECTDDERPSMIGEYFTFVKPDSSEYSRVLCSHSCFYTRVLDLLTGGGS